MSAPNLEVVQRIYEAWTRRDPGVPGEIDPEFELRPDPEAYWVGVSRTYRGPSGLLEYMSAVYEAFDDYRPEIERFVEVGDRVVTLAVEHGRGRDSGAQVQSSRTAHVWTVRDGSAVRLDLYLDRERALEDLGLEDWPDRS